ncbi:MAG: adenylate/guanylate cyclase domain-containing protein [Verrucomicrobiales bacterium]|nr:adenylate/guanylate cyclase domain-containing protein [Verrucomicrobiales bacterium]
MSNTLSRRFRFAVISIFVWVVAYLLFFYIRHAGIDELLFVEITGDPETKKYLFIYGGAGFCFGLLYALTDALFEKRFFARMAYGRLLLIKIALYTILMKLLFIAIILFLRWNERTWDLVMGGMTLDTYWVGLTYTIIVGAIFTFVRQMSQKFGAGVLWDLVRGQYRTPREEERVFMFLDLQSSTTIADQLGHVKFSQLIQDCFVDMTDGIRKNGGAIYQYVGDEVVVSWPKKKGINDGAAIRCFFAIREYLLSRKDYYESTYGVHPFFKAGIHVGWVTVAEVGVLKREISYHGDTLNTAARIEGRCNDLERDVLISGNLAEALKREGGFELEKLGDEELRGKEKPVAVYGVSRA